VHPSKQHNNIPLETKKKNREKPAIGIEPMTFLAGRTDQLACVKHTTEVA